MVKICRVCGTDDITVKELDGGKVVSINCGTCGKNYLMPVYGDYPLDDMVKLDLDNDLQMKAEYERLPFAGKKSNTAPVEEYRKSVYSRLRELVPIEFRKKTPAKNRKLSKEEKKFLLPLLRKVFLVVKKNDTLEIASENLPSDVPLKQEDIDWIIDNAEEILRLTGTFIGDFLVERCTPDAGYTSEDVLWLEWREFYKDWDGELVNKEIFHDCLRLAGFTCTFDEQGISSWRGVRLQKKGKRNPNGNNN